MKSVFIFGWTDEQIDLPIWMDEMGKNQVKSINATSVSSISTDWSIQSIWIKSDLPIFIDLSIVIDWLFRETYAIIVRWRSVKTTEQTSVRSFFFCLPRSRFYIVSWFVVQKLINCEFWSALIQQPKTTQASGMNPALFPAYSLRDVRFKK